MINEQQLENVARAICKACSKDTFGQGDNWEDWVPEAKAAIEAAFKPLPMYTMPYDTPVLLLREDGNVFQDFVYDQSRVDWINAHEKVTGVPIIGWMPLP